MTLDILDTTSVAPRVHFRLVNCCNSRNWGSMSRRSITFGSLLSSDNCHSSLIQGILLTFNLCLPLTWNHSLCSLIYGYYGVEYFHEGNYVLGIDSIYRPKLENKYLKGFTFSQLGQNNSSCLVIPHLSWYNDATNMDNRDNVEFRRILWRHEEIIHFNGRTLLSIC